MPVLKLSIWIDLPIDECFDLARDISLHPKSVPHTKERAIGGVTEGLIEAGESVTWEAVHLGVKQRLTARIQSMDRPYQFIDVMGKGAFSSLTHVHLFAEERGGTRMTDILQFEAPLGLLGRLANKLFLERHMRNFLKVRLENLKQIGEEKPLTSY
ncbi:SRPBCC family protein [Halobacillus amylolyticus]|uniref:SRPBCC family protein n=1 Tax=Halobacillus amylolyticus TaxID=2932259 RepID=A0ABY4HEQ9_9BACI|nr:SRPBCC family protein [Halobacillus amylolyticus]UOR13390.1 SRPBCC family protein [Halobacillus amylolyticus]